jgi:hypothetical protein
MHSGRVRADGGGDDDDEGGGFLDYGRGVVAWCAFLHVKPAMVWCCTTGLKGDSVTSLEFPNVVWAFYLF